jgi:hypothetical protein
MHESERQEQKYAELFQRVRRNTERGLDYTLEGAKEISLYVHRTELMNRDIFRTRDLPIERRKAGLRMSVKVYEWYVAERRKSAILGEDFHAHLRRMQASDPDSLGPAQS